MDGTEAELRRDDRLILVLTERSRPIIPKRRMDALETDSLFGAEGERL